jgi:hypothetical protein
MKRLPCIALLATTGATLAASDDLTEANRLLAAQSYDKALPLYQKLAQAGSPEAQLRLGFERAAAAGNADEKTSLASLQRRETHGQDIAYWTAGYQGEALLARRAACSRAELPAFSRTKSEVKQTGQLIAAWHTCYNGFVDQVNAALPPGKRIPAEVVDMMTPAEAKQAVAHLDAVYGKLTKDAEQDAEQFTVKEQAWRKATERYVAINIPLNQAGGYANASVQNYLSNWIDRFSTSPVSRSPAQAAR